MASPDVPQNIPAWMITWAFGLGVLLTALQIIKGFRLLFKKPALDVRLTREVFFRISEYGECLFANAVLMARRGPVEIRTVSFELTRITGSSKKYALEPLHFGERVRPASGTFSEHYFYSQSPLEFLPEDTAKRVVYLATLKEYEASLISHYETFLADVNRYKSELLERISKDVPVPEEARVKAIQKVAELQRKATDDILSKIQLEAGAFRLVLRVRYKPLGVYRFLPEAEVQSSIEFSVDPGIRDSYKWMIEQALNKQAWNTILNQTEIVQYPHYTPRDTKEL